MIKIKIFDKNEFFSKIYKIVRINIKRQNRVKLYQNYKQKYKSIKILYIKKEKFHLKYKKTVIYKV